MKYSISILFLIFSLYVKSEEHIFIVDEGCSKTTYCADGYTIDGFDMNGYNKNNKHYTDIDILINDNSIFGDVNE